MSLTPSGADSTARKPVGAFIPCEDDIQTVVIAHKQAILQCMHEQKKRQPGLSGKLVMRWSIQTNGKTKDVSCQTPELCSSYFASCLTGLIQGWSYSSSQARRGPIDFPFSF